MRWLRIWRRLTRERPLVSLPRQHAYSEVPRRLTKSPHEIAYLVAHKYLDYGVILKDIPGMEQLMKDAIFRAVRNAITEHSE